jgi:hypothetical protein
MYSPSNFGLSADILKVVSSVMEEGRRITKENLAEQVASGVWNIEGQSGSVVSVYDTSSRTRFKLEVLDEMKMKNSDAALKLKKEISSLETSISKLTPLARKDDSANMKLVASKKRLEAKKAEHSKLMKEESYKTSAGATEAKVVQAVGQIKHFAKEMYKGDIKKAYNDWAGKTTFGPVLKAEVLKRAGGVNEATDPVDKKELTKSFEKRKDKDIDNDGDTDSSDEYLHKRRKAISKAMKEEVLDEAQKLFMFKTKQEADKKAKEIKGKVIELGPKNFAVVTKDLTVIEEVDLDEDASVYKGFINLGGAKVKDDEKSILQHIKKTFPNVKKVKKDSQHGWIPVFEEVDLDEDVSVYKKTARKNKNDVTYAFGRTKKLDGQPEEKGGYWVWKLSKNYDGKVPGGIRASWVYVGKDLSYSDAVKLMNKKLGRKEFKEEVELDELSKKTLGSYVKGASQDIATKSAATGRYAERANKASDDMKKTGDYSQYTQKRKDDETADKMFNKSWKRRIGVAKAVDKLTKEEQELDELSKKTLGSYVKKAGADNLSLGVGLSRAANDSDNFRGSRNLKTLGRKASNRTVGINRAADKLTKEEVELDEAKMEAAVEKTQADINHAQKYMKAADNHGDVIKHMNRLSMLRKQLSYQKAKLKEAKETDRKMFNKSWKPFGDVEKDKKKKLTKTEKCDTIDTSPSDNKTMVQTKEAWMHPSHEKELKDPKTSKEQKAKIIALYNKKYDDTQDKEDAEAWREKRSARLKGRVYHEETILEIAGKKLTSFEKEKFYELKKKHENNKTHRLLRKQYGDKGDDIFHGKLIKMAKGTYDGTHSKNEEFEFTAEDFNNFDELAVIGRGEDLDELSKKTLGSYVKKASHDVATKAAATGRYAERANKASDDMKASGDYSKYTQKRKDDETADKMFKKSWKRRLGIGKAIDKMTKEEFELREAEAVKRGRGRPRKDAAASSETTDSGDRHIVNQMRKAVSLNGHHVVFDNGEKKHVDRVTAQAFINKYNNLDKPMHKEIISKSAIKSHEHFKNALKGKVEAPKSNKIDMPKLKSDVMTGKY